MSSRPGMRTFMLGAACSPATSFDQPWGRLRNRVWDYFSTICWATCRALDPWQAPSWLRGQDKKMVLGGKLPAVIFLFVRFGPRVAWPSGVSPFNVPLGHRCSTHTRAPALSTEKYKLVRTNYSKNNSLEKWKMHTFNESTWITLGL